MSSKKKKPKTNFSYSDKFEEIDKELAKRRPRWFLHSITWFDFEDVCQIIRAHIHSKWHQWDQSRPLEPWVNRIISNQMKNILRNHYSNFVRPCLNCPFNHTENANPSKIGSLCGFTKTGLQDSTCPLYAKWEKTKKSAYDIKMAVTIESENGVLQITQDVFNIDNATLRLHEAMKQTLPPKQYEVYHMLFVEHQEEEDVAKALGYKSNEKGRKAGYKQIKNLRKKFKNHAIILIKKLDICL
jgi:DNA-directed RNA polymerase specialized sigma24 family protein